MAAAIVAIVATGGVALVAGGIAIGGAAGGLASILGQGLTNGWDNMSVGGIAGGMLLGSAFGGFGGAGFAAGGGAAGSVALAGGGTVSVGAGVAGVAGVSALGLGANIWFAKWVPGSWPGDDPTVPPGDGFVWRGPNEVGSNFGDWYNPETGDALHPDLNHPLPKGPHWGWRKFKKFIMDIYKFI